LLVIARGWIYFNDPYFWLGDLRSIESGLFLKFIFNNLLGVTLEVYCRMTTLVVFLEPSAYDEKHILTELTHICRLILLVYYVR
jgi:hypothetical protein